LRIGYNRAARLVEALEREGLIGAEDNARRRPMLGTTISGDGMSGDGMNGDGEHDNDDGGTGEGDWKQPISDGNHDPE